MTLRFLSKLAFIVALVWFVGTHSVNAQPRRPMTPADILRVGTVSDAQISPNGSWIVYTVSTVADDKAINTLWLVSAGSASTSYPTTPQQPGRRAAPYVDWPDIRSNAAALLPVGWNASTARWSPDSSMIACISKHEDQDGLLTVKLDKR